ncbi:hypothetical protein JHK85_023675 [Glycine max]|nr:hypothetical protein JHK85_023675 [Glycine max]
MLSKGLSPDDELCNILIQGHCQANDLRKVGELLGVAIRKGWVLTLTSYRNLVRLVCMKGRVQFTLSLKNLMLALCPLDWLIIYNILMFYLLSAGNSLDVNKILTEIEEKKVDLMKLGLKPSKRSLMKVISSPCDAGDLQKALELSQEMRFRGWIHDSAIQTSIVESLLLCGKVQEAETFLDRMGEESLTPDTINYDYLIKFFCQHGRLDNYEAWTPQSLAVSGVRHDTDTDTDTTPRPVSGLNLMCLTGVHVSMSVSCPSYDMENNLRKASELMQAMQESGYQPDFQTHWSLISNLNSAKAKDT